MTSNAPQMSSLLAVFVAGGAGATLRVMLSGALDRAWGEQAPHIGVLAVNLLGCLAIGALATAIEPGPTRTAVVGGFLGGFTTYSAFAMLQVDLWGEGKLTWVAAQVLVHLVGGVVCAALGVMVARALGAQAN